MGEDCYQIIGMGTGDCAVGLVTPVVQETTDVLFAQVDSSALYQIVDEQGIVLLEADGEIHNLDLLALALQIQENGMVTTW